MSSRPPSVALRRWGTGPADPQALAAAWTDPDVQRWTAVPSDRSLGYATRWIAGEAERRDRGLAVDLVIVDPEAPDVVQGEVGLVPVAARDGWAEVGYWLLPAWRGSGRATTAVAGFSGWALDAGGFGRLVARTHPDNPASGRIVERAGYRPVGPGDDGTLVWVRDRPTPVTA